MKELMCYAKEPDFIPRLVRDLLKNIKEGKDK